MMASTVNVPPAQSSSSLSLQSTALPQRSSATLPQEMASASAAMAITTMMFNPFDVIKVLTSL